MAVEDPSGETENEGDKINISDRLANFGSKLDDLLTKGLLPIMSTAIPAIFLQGSFDGSVLETNVIVRLAVLFLFLGLVIGCVSFIWNWILDSSVAVLRRDRNQTQRDGKVELRLLIRDVQLLETFSQRYLKVVLIMTTTLLCFLAGYICLGLPIAKSLWDHHKVFVIIVLLALLSLVVSIAGLLCGVLNECFTEEMWCGDLKCKFERELNLMNGAPLHR